MFDLPIEAKLRFNAHVKADFDSRDWNIGLVTGPSGSGKSSLARQLWPEAMSARPEWGHDAALVDGFSPGLGIHDVTGLLSAVGLASPPARICPYYNRAGNFKSYVWSVDDHLHRSCERGYETTKNRSTLRTALEDTMDSKDAKTLFMADANPAPRIADDGTRAKPENIKKNPN